MATAVSDTRRARRGADVQGNDNAWLREPEQSEGDLQYRQGGHRPRAVRLQAGVLELRRVPRRRTGLTSFSGAARTVIRGARERIFSDRPDHRPFSTAQAERRRRTDVAAPSPCATAARRCRRFGGVSRTTIRQRLPVPPPNRYSMRSPAQFVPRGDDVRAKTVYDSPGIVVTGASAEYLLAMKVFAARDPGPPRIHQALGRDAWHRRGHRRDPHLRAYPSQAG